MVSLHCLTRVRFTFILAFVCIGCLVSLAEPIPGPLTVQVRSEQDNKPVNAVTVHVGARMAVTDPQGRITLDGIPTGTYDLWCQHTGYLSYRRSISLPNGQRTPQAILLTPEVVAPVKLKLVEVISAEPVSTARITLIPKKVLSALQGPLVFATDHLGQVNTIPIPTGDYQLRVEAPGLMTLDQTYTHKASGAPEALTLQAVTKSLSYRVEVKGTDGQALSAARVELWEVYPGAKIAWGTTNGQGMVSFDDLRIGRVNPVLADKSLPVGHRVEAVVRVEAAGYLTALQSLRLVDQGHHIMTLAKPLTIKEKEPNNAKGSAQPLVLGQSASLKLDDPKDEDWFRFDLPEPAQVTVKLSAAPLEVYLNLYDGAGKRVGQFGKYASRPSQGVWNLHAGHYAIQVHEWGMNNSSEAEVLLQLTGQVGADPLEDNNSTAGARMVEIGQHMRGMIFPIHDQDHFTLHLDRPGRLRLESINTPAIERSVLIVDKAGKSRATLNCYANRGGVGEWQFEPGDYEIVVSEWGNNGCALDPYDYRFFMITDDGVDDPPQRTGMRPSSVRHLPLPARTYASINPVGEHDVYTLAIPSQGILHIFQQGTTELSIGLLNGMGDRIRTGNSYANRAAHWTYPFTEATTVYLDVGEWNNNGWSPFPYELQTWFDPAGQSERLLLNDTIKTAVPIELGEMVRDSIMPTGDQDWYQLYVDQPGVLNVWDHAPLELSVTLHDAKAKALGTLNSYARRDSQINWNVIPGVYYLKVTEWGNNGEAPANYALKAVLHRAVPGETANLSQSPPIPLTLGEARPFGIEHVRDIERFHISLPEKGEYVYWVGGRLETSSAVTDRRSGQLLFNHNAYGSRTTPRAFTTEGPMELSLTVGEWGNNGAHMEPMWIMVAPKGPALTSPAVTWVVDPLDPTRVTFTLSGTHGMETMGSVTLDINNDGQPDGTLVKDQPSTLRFPKPGLYRVTTRGAPGGLAVHGEFWVQATGQPVREGLHVLVTTPGEGEFIEQGMPVRVAALSYEGKPIRQVALQIDGRSLGTDYTVPYEFDVPWQSLAGGTRTLKATATDSAGTRETSERQVQVSDYFNLLPAAGAVVTGQDVTVSWDGSGFGTAKARYRLKEEESWKEVVGQNGRSRRIRLTEMEAGKTYVFQPLGGDQPGPEREVMRVKGLAFTEAFYGGSIARDYDQKLPVAVRNHAEEPRIVRLRCDLPRNSLLLAEFVGDGEKGRPVELGPGEQRSFSLGFSAQDVVKEMHELPVYIESEDGYSDEALVEVRVKLPIVDLAWQDVTPEQDEGLMRTYELLNRGDTLTDLDVGTQHDRLRVFPEVKHGLFKAGQRLRFEVTPKIYEGFTGCEDALTATSISKTTTINYLGQLKPGEQVYRLNMTAGLDPVTGEPDELDSSIRAARRLVGQYLSPSVVDWSLRSDPQDTNRDGLPDRWTVVDDLNQTQWFGRDTDGDGQVDFAQADVGLDGEIDHASLLENGQWKPTNLLDAYLEMNFSIPKHRSKYQAHDLDLVVNGQVVGQLEQTIPEGNYRFPLAPAALDWGAQANTLEIKSRFLNYAHYAISSDFQLKTRMLNTDMYMVGTTREDAVNRLFESDKGFSTESPDYSLSSEDLDYSPKAGLKKGAKVTITGSIRNLGAGTSERLELGLFLAIPGTEGKELMRQTLDPPGMMTASEFQFDWPASAGVHSLRVVADPDNLLGESNRKNNAAIVHVTVPGEDQPPTLTVLEPDNNSETDSGTISLLATATDDAGIIGVEVTVDDGLAQALHRTGRGYAGNAHLQSGSHRLRFEVIDSGGNRVQDVRTVTVTATAPACQIIHPKAQAELEESSLRVLVSAADIDQAGVRVNNGPWFGLQDAGGTWSGLIDLPFGQCDLEVVVVAANGMRQTKGVRVTCTAQPEEEKDEEKDKEDEGPADSDASGPDKDPQTNTPQVGRHNQTPHTPQGPNQGPQGPKVGRDPSKTGPQVQGPQTTGKQRSPQRPGRAPSGSGSGGSTPSGSSNGQTGSGSGRGKGKADQTGGSAGDDESEGPSGATAGPTPIDIPAENPVTPPPDGPVTRQPSRPVPPTRTRPPARSRSPKGFAFNRQRNDWYCPNRPNIKINFKLPEWLTKEEFDKILKKGPDSKEWKNLEARLLAGFWRRGFGKKAKGQTMDKLLEKYRDLLLKRCGRLDPVDGKLPSFLQSLGFVAPDPPTDPKELAKWRNKMKELTQTYWLRLLATEDPSTVILGMQKRAKALGKYDEAAAMQADAIVDEIKANQEFTEEIIEALPYAGEVLDIYAIATGETALSGRQVDAFEMFMRSVGVGIPAAQTMYGKGKAAKKFMESFSEAYRHGGDQFKDALVNTFKKAGKELDPKVLDKAYDTINAFKKQARQAAKKQLDEVADTAGDAFRKTAVGEAAQVRKLADEKQARELIDRLNKATDPDDIADLSKKLQHDKTAQRLINDDAVPQSARNKMIDYLDDPATGKGLYQKTDKQVKNFFDDAIKSTDPKKLQNMADDVGMSPKQLKEFQDDVQAFAKKNGLDPSDLEVDVVAPTNKKTGKRTVGRDRDVTYRVKIKEEALAKAGNPRIKTMDIHHDLSTNVYQKNLWEQANPGKTLSGMDEAADFADGMDQMVTSGKHHEAYDIGDLTVEEFFEGGLGNVSVTGKQQMNNFTDTMKRKSQDWFEKKSGDVVKNTTEGMRQATKQYDKAVVARLQKYGIDADTFLDPKLAKGKEVFDQVAKGKITLEEGEHLLKAIGTSKEEVVDGIANTFRTLEDSGPAKLFRKKGEDTLRATVRSTGNSADALEATVKALKDGGVTTQAFREIRNKVVVEAGDKINVATLATYMRNQIINTAEFGQLAHRIAVRTGRNVDDVIKEARQQ